MATMKRRNDLAERYFDGIETEKWLPTTDHDEDDAKNDEVGTVRVPLGYALVPIEPTDEMVAAGDGENHSSVPTEYTRDIWAAMLAVAKEMK